MILRISWVITAMATCVALIEFFSSMGEATGAPQQAAGAAIALAIAVIPYVFSRSLEGVFAPRPKPPSKAKATGES